LGRDYTLLILEAFGRIGALFALAFGRFKKVGRYREIVMVFVAALAVISGFFAYNVLARPNAFAVYLGDENLGIMRWDRGPLDADYLQTHVLTRLASQYGAEISPTSNITANPTRAGRSTAAVSFDSMVSNLIQSLDFYVYGAEIIVDGETAAKLSNSDVAQSLLDEITTGFRSEYILEIEITQEIQINPANIHKNDLLTRSQAFNTLAMPRPVQQIHAVQQGDNLYTIASRYGMTLLALLNANPNIDPTAFLQQGQLLIVTPYIPIISVKTLERATYQETITPPTEHRLTPNLPTGTQKQIQPGQPGLTQTTANITKINGLETTREIITRETIQPAVPQIIEVGHR
jgi:LysM repeat protein